MSSIYKTVGIVGAGAMGRGIAQIAAQAGSHVKLFDIQDGAASKARESLELQWDKLLEKSKITATQASDYKQRVQATDTLQDLADCDLVIEAVVERLDIKQSLLAELEAQTGRSWKKEIKAWVHGTQELPLKTLLSSHGVVVHEDPPQMAQRLGLRVAEAQGVVQIKAVLRGGAAEKAGMAAGDEWWAVGNKKLKSQTWRLKKLEDLTMLLGTDKKAVATISRDQKILTLDLNIPNDVHTWRLSHTHTQNIHSQRTSGWLDGDLA
jgi:predicted homoserine dehydrogenase-like protein